jgi:protease-4
MDNQFGNNREPWENERQEPQYQPPQYNQQRQYPPQNTAAPKGRFRSAMKTTAATITVIRGVLSIILVIMLLALVGTFFAEPASTAGPSYGSFSIIRINGIIIGERSFSDAGYDHKATVKYINDLAKNPHDRGILLYMDTPGGTVFHSDELYLALMEYKEVTERPVYAYMSELCASGGFYVAMAADYIFANRITTTGSLGVISTMFDTSELFDNLGIRTVVIDTGEHKATGSLGTVITPQQEEVLRERTEEFYSLFVGLIANGRDMSEQEVRRIADGRLYTAGQAKDLGLIDEVSDWKTARESFETLTGVPSYSPHLFVEPSFMGQLLARSPRVSPNNAQEIALNGINALPKGVPLVVAQEFLN